MPKGRFWQFSEELFIAENRGKKSPSEIARELKRTPNAVEVHWREMKKQGRISGSLRHRKRKLVWCSKCSAYRSKIDKRGCPVCRAKETLKDKRAEEARLFALLPRESKELARPQLHGSYRSKRPKKVDTQGMDAYSTRMHEEAHDLAIEKWEVENLNRETRALQKRCERHRKKLEE